MKKLIGWLLAGAGVAAVTAIWWSGQQDHGVAGRGAGSSDSRFAQNPGQTDADAGSVGKGGSPTGPGGQVIPATTVVEVSRLAVPARPEIGAFREWAGQYLSLPATERPGKVAEGVRLAQQHRQAIKGVIMVDPRTALEQAVPMVVRQALPPEIVSQLEERLNGVGPLEVLAVSPDSDPSEPVVRRFATLNGTEYRAHVYGRRGSQMSASEAHLNGVAVDNEFAVNESPVRALETGEKPAASKPAVEVCPVSGENTTVARSPEGTLPPVTVETPAVETGTQIIYLCDGGHIRQVEEELLAGEGATGGPGAPTGAFPITRVNSTGIRKIIYMRLTFPDALQEPQSEKDAYANLKTIADYFQESSYGRLTFMGTVTPTIRLPRTAAWYISNYNSVGSNSPIMNDAKETARSLGFPPEDYHHYVVIYTGGPGSFGGLGSVNGPNTWLKTTSVGTAEHELGHNVGVWHSNFWSTSAVSTIGSGKNMEYGHTNDVMGSSGSGGHFNASMKEQLQWITPETYTTVRKSGLYRIHQFDQVRQDPGLRYAFKIAKDADRDYWVEFRQKLSSNPWFSNGVTLNWSPWGFGNGDDNDTTQGSNLGTQLLDMTPGSPDDRNDAPLVIGRTFSDYESDVHITPVAKGGTVPESMDVMVHTGTMTAGNQPPTLAISASSTTVALNTAVTFNATGADTDGDSLVYSWSFGDKLTSYNGSSFSTSGSASQTKTFTTAGHYQVQCTVSDMKGGTAVRSVMVTVGSPSTFVVSGTILDGTGNPVPNVRVHNGLTLVDYRGSFTDAAGNYRVTGLTSTATTLLAVKDGWSFTNPVTGAVQNMTGTEGAVKVSIQAFDADAGEDSNPGLFRITRTGSTVADLTVYVDFSGTAALNSDYSLSPVAGITAAPLESYVIPAGSSLMDIAVNVLSDSAQEGPETVVMSLINGSSAYRVSGNQTAQVTLSDNDTLLPQVALAVDDPEASESSAADTARFLISRTGSTASPLTVVLTVDGSPGMAINGVDYTTIGNVVIPAGASSVPLVISAENDSLIEGMELVTVTVSTSSAYVRHGSMQSGTVKINDDEIPTVTLAATDATGNENGDPIRFTLTRTGDPGSALMVNYAVGGEALHGTDYVALPGFVSFPAGSATAVVDVFPIQDSHGEPSQTVSLQLRSSSLYVIGAPSNASATITDDGDLPVVAISVTDGGVAEGTTVNPGTFRITTTGTGSGNITVNFTVTGTASSGSDFASLGGSLVIGKNTTGNLTVTPLDDASLEDAETVVVTLQPSASYQLDLQSTSAVVIKDDDSVNMVSVTATANSVAEGSTAKFFVSRASATSSALVVSLGVGGTATSGSDYTAPATTVTIPANSTGVTVDVVTLADAAIEGAETVVATVLPDSASPQLYGIESGSASFVITDAATTGFASNLAFQQTSLTVGEADGSATMTVTRSGSSAGTSTVNYVIYGGSALGSGVDYRLGAGSLSFAPGVTSQPIAIELKDDLLPEDVETAVVLLQQASGAGLTTSTAQCTLMILDDEPRVSVEMKEPFARESSGAAAVFKISRTGATTSALVIPMTTTGTAVSGNDYTGVPSSITLPAGAREYVVSLVPVQDSTAEGEETVTLSLGQGSSYLLTDSLSATARIADAQQNNPPFLHLVSPRGAAPGVLLSSTLWLDVFAMDDAVPAPMTCAWTKVSGPGLVTFTSASAVDTGASFSLVGQYVLRLTASDGALSKTLDVTVNVVSATDAWVNADIGSVSLPGSASSQYKTHAVNGSGTSLSGSTDSFHFRHRHLVGNGEIRARVRQVAFTSTSARVGVMMRDGTASGAKMAAMLVAPATSNQSLFNSRITTSASASSVSTTGSAPGFWVRLARVGNVITAYDSPDGVLWTQRGTPQTYASLSSDLLAGLAVMSNSGSTPPRHNTALLDQVQVIGAADNVGPTVNAGADGTAEVGVPRTLSGVVADADGAPLEGVAQKVAWTQVSGPPGVVFGDSSAASTTATFPQGGVYLLRLTADDGAVQTMDDVTITLDEAVITVYAYHDPARESDGTKGGFTFFREGNLDRELTVNFTLAGSVGQEGVDFQPLGTTVTFAADADFAFLLMVPIRDDLAEGLETVQATVLPGTNYRIGVEDTATNTIQDLPADDWRFEQFGSDANEPGSGLTDDFDSDGVINVLEYAFHSDATKAGANLPTVSTEGGAISITYTRDKFAEDLEYHPEWSTNLAPNGWSSNGVVKQVTPVDWRFETVRATYTPPAGTPHCFMRVRIVHP